MVSHASSLDRSESDGGIKSITGCSSSVVQNQLEPASFVLLDGEFQLGQNSHKAKIGKDPRKCYCQAKESAELRKELELAKEKRNTRGNACYHPVQDTDSHVSKRGSQALVGSATSCFVRVREMDQ